MDDPTTTYAEGCRVAEPICALLVDGDAERERLAGLFYPDPDPADTLEDALREKHEDCRALTDSELRSEMLLARLRLALTRAPSEWLTERLERLGGERARRAAQRGEAKRGRA